MDSALSHAVEQIRAATAGSTPLRIRGGGSKDFYGQALQGEILDTRGLSGIVSYEPSELVVTARAGTPLAELEALLASCGQHLAFEPPHFGGDATVGGMVAAGLAGPARPAAGAVRDYVLGIQMVNGNAEVLGFGGQVMKNVAGYDVSRLLTGALGTLGLITEVSLKVLPLATAQATLMFELDQATALRRLNAWAGQPLPLNASYWTPEQGKGRLCVRLRGAMAAVNAACKSMGGERSDELLAAAEWGGLREQTLPFFMLEGDQCLWRLSVPDTSGVLTPDGSTHSGLVEWGGALRWIKAPADAAVRLRTAAEAVGGTATLFRFAAGEAERQQAVFHGLSLSLHRIHAALKKQFDPAAIFNRARMYADL
jgi:glycolate oxidase FAD binding subunit